MIRIAIIADSPVLRAGLASLFGSEPDVHVVSTAAQVDRGRDSVGDAGDNEFPSRSHASPREVDVVVMVPRRLASLGDVLFSDGSDLDERFRGPAALVLLERLDTVAAQDAYAAGASAVLAIDARADELLAAVRAVAAGLVALPASLSAELLAGARRVSSESSVPTTAAALTSREREVLSLIAQGLANKVIASRLGITEHTVKTHIAAVYEKLNARNRAEVVIAAARQGLVML
ncbi:MAG: response regulator transcription factor [Gemmatimonadaceae bacterium]